MISFKIVMQLILIIQFKKTKKKKSKKFCKIDDQLKSLNATKYYLKNILFFLQTKMSQLYQKKKLYFSWDLK